MNFNKIGDGFGPRFKTVLAKKKITQAQFGEDTDTSKSLISRYITGVRPSGDFIIKAVSYFPDEIEFLFFGNNLDRVEEENEKYSVPAKDIIKAIEDKLEVLKVVLSQE